MSETLVLHQIQRFVVLENHIYIIAWVILCSLLPPALNFCISTRASVIFLCFDAERGLVRCSCSLLPDDVEALDGEQAFFDESSGCLLSKWHFKLDVLPLVFICFPHSLQVAVPLLLLVKYRQSLLFAGILYKKKYFRYKNAVRERTLNN